MGFIGLGWVILRHADLRPVRSQYAFARAGETK